MKEQENVNPLLKDALAIRTKKEKERKIDKTALRKAYKSLIDDFNPGQTVSFWRPQVETQEGSVKVEIGEYGKFFGKDTYISVQVEELPDYLYIPSDADSPAIIKTHAQCPTSRAPLETRFINQDELQNYMDLAGQLREQLTQQKIKVKK